MDDQQQATVGLAILAHLKSHGLHATMYCGCCGDNSMRVYTGHDAQYLDIAQDGAVTLSEKFKHIDLVASYLAGASKLPTVNTSLTVGEFEEAGTTDGASTLSGMDAADVFTFTPQIGGTDGIVV